MYVHTYVCIYIYIYIYIYTHIYWCIMRTWRPRGTRSGEPRRRRTPRAPPRRARSPKSHHLRRSRGSQTGDTGVCEQYIFFFGEPLPRQSAAETALHPRLRRSESVSPHASSFGRSVNLADTSRDAEILFKAELSAKTQKDLSHPYRRLEPTWRDHNLALHAKTRAVDLTARLPATSNRELRVWARGPVLWFWGFVVGFDVFVETLPHESLLNLRFQNHGGSVLSEG